MDGKKTFGDSWASDSELLGEGYAIASAPDRGAFKTGRPRYWCKLTKSGVSHYRHGMKVENKYDQGERLFISRDDRHDPVSYFMRFRQWPGPDVNADVRDALAKLVAET